MVVLLVMAIGSAAQGAQSAADFYKGKVIECVVPYKTGGGYDAWVRALSPFFKKYAGATLVIKNVPGAGSLVGTNKIYVSDPNGLTIGIINGPGTMQAQLTDLKGVKYDMAKFTWLARLTAEQRLICAGAKSKYKSLEAMEKATTPVKFGAPGLGSSNFYEAVLITEALGIKIDMITGYETANEVTVAIIRGEIDAQTGSFSSVINTVENGDMVAVAQYGELNMPAMAKVPNVAKVPVKAKDGKELLNIVFAMNDVGRAIVAPPGLSADRAKFLEDVLKKCLDDPKFHEIAKKQQMEVVYLNGAKAKQLAQKGLAITPALKQKLKDSAAKYQK
jgi:tripartite-type tricarboxylate transporter receptor subunit TctC